MMRMALGLAFGLMAPVPALAQSEVEEGFAGALRGCEEWVLNPASWAEGVGPFARTVGLGDKMGLVETIPEVAEPPQQMRTGNHYWRINSTADAGYFLVVSSRLPMCHITGGGGSDLQPTVTAVLEGREFRGRWEEIDRRLQDDMVTLMYRNRNEPNFSMMISHAREPGQRLDRAQVIATAVFNISN